MMNGNGQANGKEPVERVVDLFVHMPIGFAVMAWKRVPEFVGSVPGLVGEALTKGCAQIAQAEERLSEEVRKARMIGQVAVTFGGRQLRREVDARLRDARQGAGGVVGFMPGAGGGAGDSGPNGAGAGPEVTAASTPSEPASAAPQTSKATRPPAKPTVARKPAKAAPAKASRPTAKTASTAKATKPTKATKATKATKTTKGPGAAKGARTATAAPANPAPTSAADLPIREYDGLSASQVVSRLTGLTPEELRAVKAYEEASRGRRTVLLAIDRLLG